MKKPTLETLMANKLTVHGFRTADQHTSRGVLRMSSSQDGIRLAARFGNTWEWRQCALVLVLSGLVSAMWSCDSAEGAELTESTCDAVTQSGCEEGQGCRYAGASGVQQCYPAGSTLAGAACDSSSRCVAGSTCIAGLCRQYCAQDSDCSGVSATSRCAEAGFGTGTGNVPVFRICTEQCDSVSQSGCDVGEACHYAGASGAQFCYPAGKTQVGAACSEVLDCVPGSTCAGGTCTRYCTDDSQCVGVADGSRCLDGGFGKGEKWTPVYKYCSSQCKPWLETSCPDGWLCTVPDRVERAFSCYKAGTSTTTCSATNYCAKGLTCRSGSCVKWCRVGGSDCKERQTCVPVSNVEACYNIYWGTTQMGACLPLCSSDADCPAHLPKCRTDGFCDISENAGSVGDKCKR